MYTLNKYKVNKKNGNIMNQIQTDFNNNKKF